MRRTAILLLPTRPALSDSPAARIDAPNARSGLADAFRALAITAVFFNHVAGSARLTLGGHFYDLSQLGLLGVDTFFVLSGFLLGTPYARAVLGERAFPSTKLFWARRFWRIYPLYAFAVVLTALLSLHHGARRVLTLLATYLTFLYGAGIGGNVNTLDGPLWTMVIDVEFYLALPIVAWLALGVARGRARTVRLALVASLLCAATGASLLLRTFVFAHVPNALTDFPTAAVCARNVVGVGSDFALGITVGLLTGERAPRAPRAVAGACVAAGVLCAALLWQLESVPVPALGTQIAADLLGGSAVALVLYGLLHNAVPGVARLAATRPVIAYATLAYAIYLLHAPIVETLKYRLLHAPPGSAKLLLETLALAVPAALACAWAAHRFVELPCLQLRDKNREPLPTLP